MGLIIALIVLASASTSASPSPTVAIGRSTEARESGRATFVVRLAGPAKAAVTVHYATRDGSARAGSDYVRRRGTLRFMPGETTKRIVVRVLNDAEPEAAETFTVRLSRAANARLARSTARATILANDLPAPFMAVATMDGGQLGSATATLTFDAQNASVRATVSARGLGDLGGVVHLHRGGAGVEGPLLASLPGPSDNATATGTASLSRALIIQILAAPTEFYVDLHTRHGAIRGQLELVG